jgi:very-short-patch-repair endonuclease
MQRISELAARQHGVVSRVQLLRAGVSPRVIQRRVQSGVLVAIHRGVYRIGPVEVPGQREMAAVLACGDGAVASHRTAAALWELLPAPSARAARHVTVVATDGSRSRVGIRVHRVTTLPAGDAALRHGIPVTTPLRTVCDLAAEASRGTSGKARRGAGRPGTTSPRTPPSSTVAPREVEQALARALREGLLTTDELEARIGLPSTERGGRGTRLLRAILGSHTGPAMTRSEAEERCLSLFRRARLPAPEANAQLGGYELDFLWRAPRIAVEVDGYTFHGSRERFESDRARDAELMAHGIQVVRVTWRQLQNEPEAVVAVVSMALGRAGGVVLDRGSPRPGKRPRGGRGSRSSRVIS